SLQKLGRAIGLLDRSRPVFTFILLLLHFSIPFREASQQVVGISEAHGIHQRSGLYAALAGTTVHIIVLVLIQLLQPLNKLLSFIYIQVLRVRDNALVHFFLSPYIQQ